MNRFKMEKKKSFEIIAVLTLLILLLIFSLIIFKDVGRFNDDSAIGIISGMAINETTDTVENTTISNHYKKSREIRKI
jgi:hypothetical protein